MHSINCPRTQKEGYGTGGELLNEEDFDRILPVAFEPINPLGKDTFKAVSITDEIKLENNGLRALRKSASKSVGQLRL